jgi:hypothetical protein
MSDPAGFDFSLVEEPLFQFMVVADSHDRLVGAVDPEFPSRARQHDRVMALLELLKKMPAEFLMHMGDLVQDYPETDAFQESISTAVKAFHQLPMPIHHVAGNHDVGDKPDRTMPTHPASEESLKYYHELCGQSWYRIDREDCCLLVINSQILDTGMAAEIEQRAWLEAEMQAAQGKRILLFFHLPLYLGQRDEQAMGNYDILGNVSRKWLLDLIEKHDVKFTGGAHVHFAFFDTIANAEYHQFASPTFTRPGFSHLFSSGPPSERGRNDCGKLGFYLVRVFAGEIKLHFIRTGGVTDLGDLLPDGSSIVIMPAHGGARSSSLGATLREPILRAVEVPFTFPSVVRQQVRNDYPFYNLREMGAAHIRAPWDDWEDEVQRRRLGQLTKSGVSLTLFSLDESGERFPSVQSDASAPTAMEWQLPGRVIPPEAEFVEWMSQCRARNLQTALSPVIPSSAPSGKQHPRTRIGYNAAGIAEVTAWLREREESVDRLVIDLGFDTSRWETWTQLAEQKQPGDSDWDFKFEFDSVDDDHNCEVLAEAFALNLAVPGSRLFIDPLTDHDRTMDEANGLCDTMHNPRPMFNVYRSLNGILFPENASVTSPRAYEVSRPHDSLFTITSGEQKFALVIDAAGLAAIPGRESATTLWDLRRGQSCLWSDEHPVAFPYLISYT